MLNVNKSPPTGVWRLAADLFLGFPPFHSNIRNMSDHISVEVTSSGDLAKVLECPVCFNPYQKGQEIKQCSNGHHVCADCEAKIKRLCPQCRGPIQSRNRALEMMLEYLKFSDDVPRACKFKNVGCPSMLEEDESHEQLCPYGRTECPEKDCKKVLIVGDKLDEHMERMHKKETRKWKRTFDGRSFYLVYHQKYYPYEGRFWIVCNDLCQATAETYKGRLKVKNGKAEVSYEMPVCAINDLRDQHFNHTNLISGDWKGARWHIELEKFAALKKL